MPDFIQTFKKIDEKTSLKRTVKVKKVIDIYSLHEHRHQGLNKIVSNKIQQYI